MSPARVGEWRKKLVDLCEMCHLCLGSAFSLNKLLEANGLDGKTGSGAEAVALASQGRWEELAAYCRHDTVMTHKVTFELLKVTLPVRGRKGLIWASGRLTVDD